jgi:hypothetical protein
LTPNQSNLKLPIYFFALVDLSSRTISVQYFNEVKCHPTTTTIIITTSTSTTTTNAAPPQTTTNKQMQQQT